ncbi:MAG: hypothetical protein ACI9G1_003776, partial [Pirellulaceae bacterium]
MFARRIWHEKCCGQKMVVTQDYLSLMYSGAS